MKKILATIAFGLFTINAYAATFKCDSGFSLQISPSIESKFDIIVGYEGKEYPGIVRLGGKKIEWQVENIPARLPTEADNLFPKTGGTLRGGFAGPAGVVCQ